MPPYKGYVSKPGHPINKKENCGSKTVTPKSLYISRRKNYLRIMFTKIWNKITSHRKAKPDQSYRSASMEMGIPKSTIYDHSQRLKKRKIKTEDEFLESEAGQNFLKRMLVSSIYTFAIKGGVGAGRIEEFMEQMRVGNYMGISRTSIHRMIKEVEASILRYKELQEKELIERAADQKEYLEVVLGLDETWLNEMLLVCQELTSGYLFLSNQVKDEI